RFARPNPTEIQRRFCPHRRREFREQVLNPGVILVAAIQAQDEIAIVALLAEGKDILVDSPETALAVGQASRLVVCFLIPIQRNLNESNAKRSQTFLKRWIQKKPVGRQ